ncbi:DUF3137 domain-containing protein [Methylomicrobium sp. Wu6]|uniref:DUF3137 domain-containing protein n=1 Tax=Methylomicrobium sp. Wu6 TaxID=3107928 RepID=UPI002DD69787|nr:DUF3137 domain-containing protein [Methylomicrobium sp. Wu6]MEC4747314.1 DUF3137 domain-containing protein [Methylomicrobium sp. Wu6]
MKSADDFIKHYSNNLATILHDLEPDRKALLALFWTGIIFLVASVPGFVWALHSNQAIYLLASAPFAIVAVYRFYRFSQKKRAYAAEFKGCTIRGLAALIDPHLDYLPHHYIDEQDYHESDIFRSGIDRYRGDDLVEGALGATRFRFSELVHEEKHETTDSKGRKQTHWVTIFKGIFFIADFNKHFQGKTYVVPDARGSLSGLGKLFEKCSSGRGDIVELENPEFEKLFTVYGTDQVEARYILSPSLMERLVNFRNKASTRVHIAFIHSKLYVALPVNKDLFEPKIFSSSVQSGYLRDYFRYLALVAGIVDDLNLNLRIWKKV